MRAPPARQRGKSCTQGTLDALEQRAGRVVAISSLGGMRVVPSYGAIGVSKAALEATTRYLGAELAPRGIRVNAVSGGLIETGSAQLHPDYAGLAKRALAHTPLGRLTTADDIAGAVLFLCSPLSSAMIGQTIVVDGGGSLVL